MKTTILVTFVIKRLSGEESHAAGKNFAKRKYVVGFSIMSGYIVAESYVGADELKSSSCTSQEPIDNIFIIVITTVIVSHGKRLFFI